VAIDRVGVELDLSRPAQSGIFVTDKLVAEQIEVDPVFGAAAFGAAQQPAVESACLGDVAHLYGDVKRGQ
jgi:hypothetical protein